MIPECHITCGISLTNEIVRSDFPLEQLKMNLSKNASELRAVISPAGSVTACFTGK